MARRDGGREPEVEGRLELLAPARLRRERRLPVSPEAPLVVDDAERARAAVPVDAIELTAEHELGERDGRALLEPDGRPVAERCEVEGSEGLDRAHDLRKAHPEDATERQVRLALEFRRDVGRGSRQLRCQMIGVEVARRQPAVEALEQRMHELADLAGAQVFPFDDLVGGEDSQDLLGEVAERAGGEALEAGRRQAADRAGHPLGRERPHASLERAHLALAIERGEERPRPIEGERVEAERRERGRGVGRGAQELARRRDLPEAPLRPVRARDGVDALACERQVRPQEGRRVAQAPVGVGALVEADEPLGGRATHQVEEEALLVVGVEPHRQVVAEDAEHLAPDRVADERLLDDEAGKDAGVQTEQEDVAERQAARGHRVDDGHTARRRRAEPPAPALPLEGLDERCTRDRLAERVEACEGREHVPDRLGDLHLLVEQRLETEAAAERIEVRRGVAAPAGIGGGERVPDAADRRAQRTDGRGRNGDRAAVVSGLAAGRDPESPVGMGVQARPVEQVGKHLSMDCRITHHAAFANLLFARFKLGLDQGDHWPLGFEQRKERW